MQDEKTTNSEYKEYLFNEIVRWIKAARLGDMELSLKEIAQAISESLEKEELEILIKELQDVSIQRN